MIVLLLLGAAFLLVLAAASGDFSSTPHRAAPEFAEPVVLSSANGVLEVTLYAQQGVAHLDTVATPVHNFLLFGYELQQGTASNGESEGENLYPGPTLQVFPGEKLIVHIVNELADLTIRDFYDPAFTPVNDAVPLYPRQLTSSPFNLHTHGLHVSPKGNSDNVLLDIPAGYTNTYTYDIPADHPQGMYWYHSHRHTVTAQQTYLGLAGMLMIGRSDGNLPAVTQDEIPIRNMALQYNYVFDREGGGTVLTNVTWPQWVSTLQSPEGTQLADGSYVPLLAPADFAQAREGAQYFTVWYAGPLSIDNMRGQLQFIPGNYMTFTSNDGSVKVPAHASLPDHLRDLQYTVNGQFQPAVKAKPGQTEIWVLANVSDIAYFNVTLTETATGKHPPIILVGQDGNPFPAVEHALTDGGTTLAISPGSRFAVAVTMPAEGELVLEMATANPVKYLPARPGVLYTSNGTEQPSAVLGSVSVDPFLLSYFDGFFAFPTQVLLRMVPESGTGRTTAFVPGQPLGASTSFVELATRTPAVERKLVVSGGFGNQNANKNDPKSFEYQFDDNVFPNTPLLQPRLGSVEQWSFINNNNDEHPIHVHVNDFEVTELLDPVRGFASGVQRWGQDNANLPAPLLGPREAVIVPGSMAIRNEFLDFTGAYVMHCHRLNHEDNGLMVFVNVIPAVSSYAVASSGDKGSPATVRVYDANGDRLIAAVTPFPGFAGPVSVAMGDVDGDQVLDLVSGKGPGGTPEVAVFSGADLAKSPPVFSELLRFVAFDESFTGGVSVAATNVDGNALADNVIVGSGPGMASTVKVFGSTLPAQLGAAPEIFATFAPYSGNTSGVTVATGLVDAVSGRNTIVTAPGAGSPARIKTFRFDLYRANTGPAAWCAPSDPLPPDVPRMTSEFLAFDAGYTGGVSLATGWIAGGKLGGARSIVVAQSAAPGTVKVFSSGSALDGQPAVYLLSPDKHDGTVAFRETASFVPFADAPTSGVRVAATSTTSGADVLASALDPHGKSVRVRKYGLERASADATTLAATLLSEVEATHGTAAHALGGD